MAVTDIAHVLLLSDDIDATRDFWCRTLGLEQGERPALAFPGYWLYADGRPCVHIADRARYHAHAETIGLPAPASGAPGERIDHIAFSETDYAAASARLAHEHVEPVRNEVPGAGLRQLFFADPAGVRIEVNVTEPCGQR
jgi:catechol 2,3-dioxygenase-like lactoylglutathione lyase family enzyme